MADFNVKVSNQENSAGFVGASQGIKAPEAQNFSSLSGKAAKTSSLATTVSQAGDLFATGVKVADDAIKQGITDQAYQGIDQVRSEFGVDDTTTIKGTDVSNEPVPTEISKAEKNLSRLNAAYKRNAVDENSYWARVESVSRQLRAKYPGHRDYIDSRVSSIAGGDPANNIIRNLQEQAKEQSRQANSEMNKKSEYAQELNRKGINIEGWRDMSLPDLIDAAAPQLRTIARVEQDKAVIELAKSRNEASDILVTRGVTNYVNDHVDQATRNLINPTNKSYKEITDLFDKGTRQGSLSPDEQTHLRALMADYRLKVSNEVMAGIRENFGGDVTPKMIQDAKSQLDSHFDIIEKALGDKDYGVLNYTTHALEAGKTDGALNLSKDPVLNTAASLTQYLGPQASETFFQWNPSMKTARDKTLTSRGLVDLVTKGKSLFNIQSELGGNTDNPGVFNKETLDRAVALLNSKDLTPDGLKNLATGIYGPENARMWSNVPIKDRELYFNRFINNTVFDKMKKARDSGDTESYQNYVGWVKHSFPILFRKGADELSKTVGESGGISVTFSPDSNMFVINSPDPNSANISSKDRASYGQSYAQVQGSLNKINTAIRGVLPILKEEGIEPTQYLSTAFSNLGMDTQGNVLGMAQGAISRAGMKGRMNLGGEVDSKTGLRPVQLSPGEGVTTINKQGGSATDLQIDPAVGDRQQIDETASEVNNRKAEIDTLKDLMKQDPGNTKLMDTLEKSLVRYHESLQEYYSLIRTQLRDPVFEDQGKQRLNLKPTK